MYYSFSDMIDLPNDLSFVGETQRFLFCSMQFVCAILASTVFEYEKHRVEIIRYYYV